MENNQQANETPPEPLSMKQVTETFGCDTTDNPTFITEDIRGYIKEIKEIDAEAKTLKSRKDYLRDKIASHMLNSAYLIDEDDGSTYVTWKKVTSIKFNQSRFKVEQPELLQEYMDAKESRLFLIK